MQNKSYFFSPFKSALIAAIAVLLGTILASFSLQPPPEKTGAPGENNCTQCHSGANPDYSGSIFLEGLPNEFVANQTYSLTLKVISSNVTPVKGGFSLVVLDSAANNIGAIGLTNTNNTSFQTGSMGREYVGHKSTNLFGNSDTISWSFDWTAPSTANDAHFYASVLLSNSDGSTNGDNVITFSDVVSVVPVTPMEVIIDNISEPHCNGYTNGVAHATVVNGTQPYTYLWSTGDTLAWVYQFSAGTHSVTVTDADSLVATQTFTLDEPDLIIPEIIAATLTIPCGDSVILYASATGGTPPLTYSWNTGAGNVDSIIVKNGGYYCLVVTDSNQCQQNVCVGVNQDQFGVFCNGITADSLTCINPTSVLYPGVTSNDTIMYSWTGPNGFTSADESPQISEGGTYNLTASITSGCSCSSTIEVQDLTNFEIQVNELIPTTCYYSQDGEIDADIISGDIEPFTTVPADFMGDSLSQGSYSVTVTNGVGCTTVVDFAIEGPDSINVVANILNIVDATSGAINITTTGGTPEYSYSWTPMDSTSMTNTDGSLTNITTPGDYSLVVSDTSGCSYPFGPFTVGLIDYIEDIEFSNSITISPNPTSDFIMITQNEKVVELDVLVYGINNKLVYTTRFSERQNRIDLDNLPNGLYQVILKSDSKFASKRIMLTK